MPDKIRKTQESTSAIPEILRKKITQDGVIEADFFPSTRKNILKSEILQ
jgi:hypothetical protein